MEIDVLTGLETKLLQMSKVITDYKDGRFRNMSTGDKEGYTELRETFPEHEDLVFKYVNKVYYLFKDGKLKHVPLPPFIVFPMYTPTTVGWRMGAGESYSEIWHQMVKPLSETEKKEYCGKYDYPAWWVDAARCGEFTHCRYYHLPWRNKSGQK